MKKVAWTSFKFRHLFLILPGFDFLNFPVGKNIVFMEEMIYVSPTVEVQEFYSEGVLCQSTTEDVEFGDGEW